MKKTHIILALLLMTTLPPSLYAQSISMLEAKTAAVTAMNAYSLMGGYTISNIDTFHIRQDTIPQGSRVLLYEVLFTSGEKVLLSGNRKCQPILGFDFSGEHVSLLDNWDDLPSGLQFMLEEYAEQVQLAYNDTSRFANTAYAQWDSLLNSQIPLEMTRSQIGPLLTTMWGQSAANFGGDCNAYNYYVTESHSSCECLGNHCPTGCVATAMAQIMNYWKYPVWQPSKTYQYDWCNMPDELNVNQENYVNERNAIARLMRDCGSSVDMDYCGGGVCSSGAQSSDVRDAMVDDFQYDEDADFQRRMWYSDNVWVNRVKNNLNQGWPVYYAGRDKKRNVGHAFVCDGWKSGDLFHFNWGWNGYYQNVWLTLNSITPLNGSSYTSNQKAVFYIHPAYTQDYCNFNLPLYLHYWNYYTLLGNTAPQPYLNVPKTATTLTSVPINSSFPATWRTIPANASSEYVAHQEVVLLPGFTAQSGSNFVARIAPCYSCDVNRESPLPVQDTLAPRNHTAPASPKPSAAALNIYPNPANSQLTVECNSAIREVTVYDLAGRIVRTGHTPSHPNSTQLNISGLHPGIYLLRVLTDSGIETGKFVKK